MKKTIIAVCLLAAFTIACKKSKDPVPVTYPEETFLDGYLNQTGFAQKVTNLVNSGASEFGNEFVPTVKGSITKLTVKLPDANAALRITIWDKLTNAVLRTETVNVVSANTTYIFDIADLALTKDKEYAITMNSDDWYNRTKNDGTNATYPITVGNIRITTYKYANGSAQTYPTINPINYYAGDIAFVFQRTE